MEVPIMSALNTADCYLASVHDLPAPLLAHIFKFIERKDVLSVLLVSKAWLAAAEDHCEGLWDELWLDSDLPCLEGALAKRDFQTVFEKRAANSSTVHMLGCKEAFQALLPSLLQALKHIGSRLRELDLEVVFFRGQHYDASCKAVAQLTALRRLRLLVDRDEEMLSRNESLALTSLRQLSHLTCLEALDVDAPWGAADEAQALRALLPSLASLTQLAWSSHECNSSRFKVFWLHPDGSGPTLRHLRLRSCRLGMLGGGSEGANSLLRSLQHLETLKLEYAVVEAQQQHFLTALPQLPALTSLTLKSLLLGWPAEHAVLQAAVQCPHLQELSLSVQSMPPEGGLPHDLPPGSLQQLTRLVLTGGCDHEPPAWSLPQLKCFHLGIYGATNMQSLGLHQSLEELEVRGNVLISQVTQAISQLTRLTSLFISSSVARIMELHSGPYLAGLKELTLQHFSDQEAQHTLPQALAQASALERLDLSNYKWLALQMEDMRLLDKLPRLKSVHLPVDGPGEGQNAGEVLLEHNAAVKHIQEKLSEAGVTVEVVPAWKVVVPRGKWSIFAQGLPH